MVYLWVLGEEIFQDVGILMLIGFQRQVYVSDLYLWKMVLHVGSESHFAVLLLLAHHFSVFGLLQNHDLFLATGNHHEHFCCEITTCQ